MTKKAYRPSTRQQKTTIAIIPQCVWCGSSRVGLYECSDDWGTSVSIRCDACEAQGPFARVGIAGGGVTHDVKREAANKWNIIWDNFPNPPAAVKVDLIGDEEIWHRDTAPRTFRPRRLPRPIVPVAPEPAPERYFTCRCAGTKHGKFTGCSGTGAAIAGGLCAFCVAECTPHQVHAAPAPKTNGVNGHQNGAI